MANSFKDKVLNNKSLKIEEKKGDDKTKIIEKGGIVIGMTKDGDKEKIHYIKDDVHTLVVGATRSGKSRCLVIPSICTIGLSGKVWLYQTLKESYFNIQMNI